MATTLRRLDHPDLASKTPLERLAVGLSSGVIHGGLLSLPAALDTFLFD